jgi:hypothetical protein
MLKKTPPQGKWLQNSLSTPSMRDTIPSAMILGLIDILKIAGFDESKTTKLVRHRSQYDSIEELRRKDWVDVYQAYQKKPVFHNVEQIVSFYGLSNNRASFYGVYSVLGRKPSTDGVDLPGCSSLTRWRNECKFFYILGRDKRFDSFRDRIIIDWGTGARKWDQKLKNKPIVEILSPGRKLEPFRDFLEFSLTYAQLKDLFANEEAHHDWKIPLSNVAGRWKNYAKAGHGDNVKLRRLLASDSDYPNAFRFSVLHILPRTMSSKEVIQREKEYMIKLGTRAIGLN